MRQLSDAIYQEDPCDRKHVDLAIAKLNSMGINSKRKAFKGLTNREKNRHIRTFIGDGYDTALRVLSIVKTHRTLDQ